MTIEIHHLDSEFPHKFTVLQSFQNNLNMCGEQEPIFRLSFYGFEIHQSKWFNKWEFEFRN